MSEKKTSRDVRPIDDRILVKPFEAKDKTSGGLVLPDVAKEIQYRGEVIACGPGKLLDSGERSPLTVKVGMAVIYKKYSGTEIKIDGETYRIMREHEALGILEGSNG